MIVRKPRVRHQLYGLQTGGPREAGVLKLTLAVHITILSRLPHHPVRQRDRLVLELCYTLAGNMHKILNRSREAFRAGDLLPYLNRRHMASSCKLADGERFGQCQTSLTRAMVMIARQWLCCLALADAREASQWCCAARDKPALQPDGQLPLAQELEGAPGCPSAQSQRMQVGQRVNGPLQLHAVCTQVQLQQTGACFA